VRQFELQLAKELEKKPYRIIIRADKLNRIADAAARILLHARQSPARPQVYVVGACESVRGVCRIVDPSGEGIRLVDSERGLDSTGS
jgi:hypothetical protein